MENNDVLVPKSGYVERYINGVLTLVPTEETQQMLQLKEENETLRTQVATLDGALTDLIMNVIPSLSTT